MFKRPTGWSQFLVLDKQQQRATCNNLCRPSNRTHDKLWSRKTFSNIHSSTPKLKSLSCHFVKLYLRPQLQSTSFPTDPATTKYLHPRFQFQFFSTGFLCKSSEHYWYRCTYHSLAFLLGTPVYSNLIQYNSSALNSTFMKLIHFQFLMTLWERW